MNKSEIFQLGINNDGKTVPSKCLLSGRQIKFAENEPFLKVKGKTFKFSAVV